MNATSTVANIISLEKKSVLNGIQTHDLCNPGGAIRPAGS